MIYDSTFLKKFQYIKGSASKGTHSKTASLLCLTNLIINLRYLHLCGKLSHNRAAWNGVTRPKHEVESIMRSLESCRI